MANVTNIKSIANDLLVPATFKDGENPEKIFSVPASGGWDGELWVPWVGDNEEMNKAIQIDLSDTQIWLFQDYRNPPDEDAVKYSQDGTYTSGEEVEGNNKGGGDKTLRIRGDETLYMM